MSVMKTKKKRKSLYWDFGMSHRVDSLQDNGTIHQPLQMHEGC